MKEAAHIAYDGYRQYLSESLGQPLEAWHELPETIREAWRAAINALH